MLNWKGEGETSAIGGLLQLIPEVEDADLRKDLEESLKKMP